MRLLDTGTAEFRWVDEPRYVPYAILSHVWVREGEGPPEQSYEDVRKIMARRPRRLWFSRRRSKGTSASDGDSVSPKLSEKIRRCCAIAREHGFESAWIDSCCIDKGSSSELSEAINSMFSWYRNAKVCYVYLHDVDDEDDPRAENSQFRRSRWFTRGWTLQELIAPRVVVFLSKGWRVLGTKSVLASVIEQVTGIDSAILTHEASLDTVSVARRISWAAWRHTTREEDEAYSLMGILGVNLPTIYGEGRLAFIRLQEEVLKQTSDQSLFAWGPALRDNVELVDNSHSDLARHLEELEQAVWDPPDLRNLFTLSPRDFASAQCVFALSRQALIKRLQLDCPLAEYTTTSHGIRTTVPFLTARSDHSGDLIHLAILACQDAEGRLLALILHDQERASNEYYVGAFFCPTMTIEDKDRSKEDPRGELLLGEQYFRITSLSHHFIATHRHTIRLQEIYVPHRPSRTHIEIFAGHKDVYAALTRCAGSFDVLLAGWCQSLLEKEGFTVSPPPKPADFAVEFSRKRGFIICRGSQEIRIEVDACSCEGGPMHRWLRVVVSTPGTHRTLSQSLDSVRRTFVTRHNRDHSDHVRSWSFAAGLASKQFHVHFPDGQGLTVQLNLGLDSLPHDGPLHRTYTLGIEIFDSPALRERSLDAVEHLQLPEYWIPPIAIIDSSSANKC